jgi:hypothetical protein
MKMQEAKEDGKPVATVIAAGDAFLSDCLRRNRKPKGLSGNN